jgi:hypothetical protein
LHSAVGSGVIEQHLGHFFFPMYSE